MVMDESEDLPMQEAAFRSTDSTGKFLDTTKQLLQWLYANNSQRLSLRQNYKGKNRHLWKQFKLAYLDNVEQQYAMCGDCLAFVKYCGRTGTGGLVRHLCFRRAYSAIANKIHNKQALEPSSGPSRVEIEELVQNNSSRIGYIPNYRGKSDVWTQFDIITLDSDTVNYAACKLCRSIVTYVSRTGTGSMTRHKCRPTSPEQETAPQNLTKFKTEAIDIEDSTDSDSKPPPPQTESSSSLTDYQLKTISELLQANYTRYSSKPEPIASPPEREAPETMIRRQYLELLRRSLGAYNTMRNDVFYDMAQALVNIGAEFGRIDIRQVLANINFDPDNHVD